MALAGCHLRWGRIMAAGTVITLIIYLIRLLPITFGLHTVAAMLLLALFIIKTTNAPATRIFLGIFAGCSILAILETAIFEAFVFFTKMDPVKVISNKLLWTELGMLQSFMLIFFAIAFAKLKPPEEATW
jgi:hypothetical protein